MKFKASFLEDDLVEVRRFRAFAKRAQIWSILQGWEEASFYKSCTPVPVGSRLWHVDHSISWYNSWYKFSRKKFCYSIILHQPFSGQRKTKLFFRFRVDDCLSLIESIKIKPNNQDPDQIFTSLLNYFLIHMAWLSSIKILVSYGRVVWLLYRHNNQWDILANGTIFQGTLVTLYITSSQYVWNLTRTLSSYNNNITFQLSCCFVLCLSSVFSTFNRGTTKQE